MTEPKAQHPMFEGRPVDPRDPDPSREGIFRDHNCWKCGSGARPCANGSPNRCDQPQARND